MISNIDLDKLTDDYLINYYQDLMFNLAKSSKHLQDVFLQAYYNTQDASQNKLINKINLYAILGYSAIQVLVGADNTLGLTPYLLSLTVGAYNFVAERYNRAKLISNKNALQNFILKHIDDKFLEIAAFCDDDSKMERVLSCIDKAFYNIVLSEEHIIRIQNYRYMYKCKKTTNCPHLNEKLLNDNLILLSKCILETDVKNSEHLLYKNALLGDISSIVMLYLAGPSFRTEKIDNFVNNLFALNNIGLSYDMFMACFLSDMFEINQMQEIKQKLEFDNKNIFLENSGKHSDFSAMCECFYYKTIQEIKPLTIEEEWAYKKAKRYLKHCKTEVSFFYKAYERALLSGKKQQNGIAALKNFASRGLSGEIKDFEKITVKNIYAKEE